MVSMRKSLKREYLFGMGLLLLIVSAMLAVPVSAMASDIAGQRVIRGRGALWAKGSGLAILKGTGTIVVEGKGVGSVWVKGAELLVAQGEGRRFDFNGGVLFVGWRGRVSVAGTNMIVQIEGGLIEFTAVGVGTAYLVGRGTYRIGSITSVWDSISVNYSA